MQNFVPANISHLLYRTLYIMLHLLIQIANFSTRKTCLSKIAENVPANNCHPKVCHVAIIMTINKLK